MGEANERAAISDGVALAARQEIAMWVVYFILVPNTEEILSILNPQSRRGSSET